MAGRGLRLVLRQLQTLMKLRGSTEERPVEKLLLCVFT